MNDKLTKLTETLYTEGIEKGKKEADVLLEQAKQEAKKIVEDAKQHASNIIASVEKEEKDKRHQMESEISIASKQMYARVRERVSSLISLGMVDKSSVEAFNDKQFLQQLILKVVESWGSKGGDTIDLKLLLPDNFKNEFESFIKESCADKLNKGLEVTFSEDVKEGFRVTPKDSSYAIEFSDESFKDYFANYLRPAIKDLLFS
ncbi:MAG: hypothetical protein ISR65_01285 [Bacteriovoracaceae bacterium]|nr:hypothetical protein [Bacteriovoracaceae bacterium]